MKLFYRFCRVRTADRFRQMSKDGPQCGPYKRSRVFMIGERYRWQLLRCGPLWLDGGSMFGVVPRVIWSKVMRPDEKGRVALGHNCLLLEKPGGGRIVIEAGSGEKFDAKNREIFGLGDRWLGTAIAEAGCDPREVEHAIVSHLHFDHMGGLTRLAREGEEADWSDGKLAVKVTFPRAEVIAGRREWEDARSNRAVMTRTYLPENLEPLADRVRLVDAPAPFDVGVRLERDALPSTKLEERMTEALPGIFVFNVPGHTWGQQAILFVDLEGRTIVFTPDVMPTVNHVGAAYNMAYDVEPYVSTVTRRWFLKEAVERDWALVIDHEPGNPVRRVREDGKGWYRLEGA